MLPTTVSPTITVRPITAVPTGIVAATAFRLDVEVISVRLPESTEAEAKVRPAGHHVASP